MEGSRLWRKVAHEGVKPKIRCDMHLNQYYVSDIKELTVFLFHDTIFLQGMRTSGSVNNITITAKGMQRNLDKTQECYQYRESFAQYSIE